VLPAKAPALAKDPILTGTIVRVSPLYHSVGVIKCRSSVEGFVVLSGFWIGANHSEAILVSPHFVEEGSDCTFWGDVVALG